MKKPVVEISSAPAKIEKKSETVVTEVSVSPEKDDVQPSVLITVRRRLPSARACTMTVQIDGTENIATMAVYLNFREVGLDTAKTDDDARFGEVRIDSLMSLLISEKVCEELDVAVSGSLFSRIPNDWGSS